MSKANHETDKKPAARIRHGLLCVVEGPGFRCVATLDFNATWRSYFSHREVWGPVKVLNEIKPIGDGHAV